MSEPLLLERFFSKNKYTETFKSLTLIHTHPEEHWTKSLSLALPGCVTLSTSLTLSGPQFPHLLTVRSKPDKSFLSYLDWRIPFTMYVLDNSLWWFNHVIICVMCNKEVILKTYFRYMYDIKINLSNIHSIIRLVSTSHLSCNAKCLIYFFFFTLIM